MDYNSDNLVWGLLGPETIGSERRTRTLGLGAAVRTFNDLAVPGMGGVWFGKQLFLATLGVAVAEEARRQGMRVRNIEVANAVEALACWRALENNDWNSDPRLRGARKMSGKSDVSFSKVRKPSFYVTQPMRQATIQPLRSLGLVDATGERFNSFTSTEFGKELIYQSCRDFKTKWTVLDYLVGWITDRHDGTTNSPGLTNALSPLVPMSESAREILRERLANGVDAPRRETALEWVERLRHDPPDNSRRNEKPACLDENHWRDLHSGAQFFKARDAAIGLLNEIEAHIADQGEQQLPLKSTLPHAIIKTINELRDSANEFLQLEHDPTPRKIASDFCRKCTNPSETELVAELVELCDGRGLRNGQKDNIVPGTAFRGRQAKPETARSSEEDGSETEVTQTIPVPDFVSHRVRNLFLFNLDLHGELDNWLKPPTENSGDDDA